jgi:hypothetical protein
MNGILDGCIVVSGRSQKKKERQKRTQGIIRYSIAL